MESDRTKTIFDLGPLSALSGAHQRNVQRHLTGVAIFWPGVLDGMAPHVWHGASAARDWYSAVLAEGDHAGAAGYHVEIGKPVHADVTGEAAYVVSPASMTFTVGGLTVTQTGATFTTALREIDGEWRIVAWAWAKGQRVM